MKKREVVIAPEARADLFWIYDTIATNAHPNTALAYVGRIEAFCERLSYASERGHRRDDVRQGLRIIGFEKRVTVAFAVADQSLTILRLFYGGRDWENILDGDV